MLNEASRVFVEWLANTTSGRRFSYDRVNLAHHAFLVEAEVNDDSTVWYTWGNNLATIHSNRYDALRRYESLIRDEPVKLVDEHGGNLDGLEDG